MAQIRMTERKRAALAALAAAASPLDYQALATAMTAAGRPTTQQAASEAARDLSLHRLARQIPGRRPLYEITDAGRAAIDPKDGQ